MGGTGREHEGLDFSWQAQALKCGHQAERRPLLSHARLSPRRTPGPVRMDLRQNRWEKKTTSCVFHELGSLSRRAVHCSLKEGLRGDLKGAASSRGFGLFLCSSVRGLGWTLQQSVPAESAGSPYAQRWEGQPSWRKHA